MLRTLIQEHDQIKVLIAGAYLLEEFSGWQHYLVNVEMLYLGYLSKSEATKLIKKGSHLQYEPEALDSILYITHCHPALIQLICKELINQVNLDTSARMRFTISVANVEQAVNKALKTGKALFSHATHPSHYSDNELKFLSLLSKHSNWVHQKYILASMSEIELQIALKHLQQRQLIEVSDNHQNYRFEIEFIRRWFAQI